MTDQTSVEPCGALARRVRLLAVLATAVLALGHALLPASLRVDEHLLAWAQADGTAGSTTAPRESRGVVDLSAVVVATAAARAVCADALASAPHPCGPAPRTERIGVVDLVLAGARTSQTQAATPCPALSAQSCRAPPVHG